jgi:HSP20 family protein
MDLVRWEPFDGLNGIHSRITRLFDEAFGPSREYATRNSPSQSWYPPVDVLESREAYLIRAELPGIKKEDINLEFRDGAVTLSGERKFDEPADGVEYHRNERVAGKFMRSFYLPLTIKQEELKATYRDGILEIHVPKSEEAKPKQIAINLN